MSDVFVCGFGPADPPPPPDPDVICCMGVAVYGPERCTCWVPIYSAEQLPYAGGEVVTRSEKCGDCAFRKGSPELADEFTREDLLSLGPNHPFLCHQGMRLILEYRHPDGRVVPAVVENGVPREYVPGDHDGVSLKADGTPADRCAGWAALNRVDA